MPEGVGGDPFPSPDGKHIVLVGRNGGEKLRILKTGANGELSVRNVEKSIHDFTKEKCPNPSTI